jgi:hypothetical protein
MAYLLDANVFIEAKQRHYGMDFCPAFWNWLVDANGKGLVFSIERVFDELEVGEDELAEWATERGNPFFLPPDQAMLSSLAAVADWVRGQDYRPAAVSSFLDDADYYLIAFAHAHKHTVVTQEVPSDGVRRVKIPNVCIGMEVKYFNAFQMLRRERARFVLAGTKGTPG